MTDYGQFYDKEGNLLKNDEPTKTERCSQNKSLKVLIKYARELNKVRQEASDAGICLDDLEEAAKELA